MAAVIKRGGVLTFKRTRAARSWPRAFDHPLGIVGGSGLFGGAFLQRREGGVAGAPPLGPAGVVDPGVFLGDGGDDFAQGFVVLDEAVEEVVELVVLAGGEVAVGVLAVDDVAEAVGDAQGAVDLGGGLAVDVEGGVGEPGVVGVAGDVEGARGDEGVMPSETFAAKLAQEIATRALPAKPAATPKTA